MATKYLIDTHTLLWYIADDPALSANAGAILDDPSSEFVLPATVLAEACWIIQRGRVALSLAALFTAIDTDPRIILYPLDRTVIERSNGLAAISEMHDRQIAATALVLQDQGETITLLTKDQNITTSGAVSVLW